MSEVEELVKLVEIIIFFILKGNLDNYKGEFKNNLILSSN